MFINLKLVQVKHVWLNSNLTKKDAFYFLPKIFTSVHYYYNFLNKKSRDLVQENSHFQSMIVFNFFFENHKNYFFLKKAMREKIEADLLANWGLKFLSSYFRKKNDSSKIYEHSGVDCSILTIKISLL